MKIVSRDMLQTRFLKALTNVPVHPFLCWWKWKDLRDSAHDAHLTSHSIDMLSVSSSNQIWSSHRAVLHH